MKVAQIYIKQKNQRIDKAYNYLVPDEVEIGQRVVVPFGKGNRLLEGIIIDFNNSNLDNLKEIQYIIDSESLISSNQLALALFLKEKTYRLFYEGLNNFTAPIKTSKRKNGIIKSFSPKEDYLVKLTKLKKVKGSIQQSIIEALVEKDLKFSELKELVPKVSIKNLTRLKELGVIDFKPIKIKSLKETDSFPTTQGIKQFVKLNDSETFLDFIKKILTKSTGQTLFIFPNNFLANKIHQLLNKENIKNYFYNPNLGSTEDYNFYQNVRLGNYQIILSTYKGIFLNYRNLESIILINISDPVYTPSQANHFNVIETVQELAQINEANQYFIDNIDTVESNYLLNNSWEKVDLTNNKRQYKIQVETIELNDNQELFSKKLKNEIIENLNNRKKTLLLMNRKGYYNYFNCSKCHQPLRCPRCGSILKGIKSDKEVECRTCGFTGSFPDECSYCGNKEFNKYNFGINRILEEVKKLAPEAKIEPFFNQYQGDTKNADIIVATSQILYTPIIDNIATVGCVLIDVDFNYPDYLAPENAYQFYNEVFSRYHNANIIIQTQYLINSFIDALDNKPEKFFKEQIEYRKLAHLPPYNDLYMFTLTAKNSKQVTQDVNTLKTRLGNLKELEILKAFVIRRIKGVSQRRFIVKDKKNGILKTLLKDLYKNGEIEALNSKIQVLVNPGNIM